MTTTDWKSFADSLFKLGYVVFPVKFEKDLSGGKDHKKPMLSEKLNWKMEQFRIEKRQLTEEEFNSLPFENAEAIETMCDVKGCKGYLYGFDFDFPDVDFTKLPEELQKCYREKTHSGNWRIPFFSEFNIHALDQYKGFELLADSKMMVLYDPKILESQNILRLEGEPQITYDHIAKALGLEKKTYSIVTQIDKTKLEEILRNGVSKGDRHETIFYLGSLLRKIGMQKDEMLSFMAEFNEKNNIPPLGLKEIVEIVNDVFKNPEPYFGKALRQKVEAKVFYTEEGQIDKVKTRESIVQNLLGNFTFATLENTREIYVYENGVFVSKGKPERIITEKAREILKESCTRYDINEIINTIQVESFENYDFFENVDKNLVCVANGILNLSTKELKEWNPEIPFLNKIDVIYDPEKFRECPLIDKFLHEVLSSEEDVLAIYEYAGYCLLRDYPFHKAFMFEGSGNNGKSTLIMLLVCFLGTLNISKLELQQLQRFNIAELHGKLANFCADLRDVAFVETGLFKWLTGGDYIDAEIKFIQRHLNFINYAKFCFSCNEIPDNPYDDTDAFWNRWTIFQFTKVFDFEHGNEDKNIIQKITTPEELSGFLVKALEGLERLLKNGKFSNDRGIDYTKKMWTANDTVRIFVDEGIETDISNCGIPDPVLFEGYSEFCKNRGFTSYEEPSVFGRKFKKYLDKKKIAISRRQLTISGIRGVWCYVGIKLKPTQTEETKIEDYSQKPIKLAKCPKCSKPMTELDLKNYGKCYACSMEETKQKIEANKEPSTEERVSEPREEQVKFIESNQFTKDDKLTGE